MSSAPPMDTRFFEIEEDVIRLLNEVLEVRDLAPALCLKILQAASVDFEFIRNFSAVLYPYVEDGIPEDPEGRRRWKAVRETWRKLQRLEFVAFCQKNHINPGVFLNLRAILVDRKTQAWWTIEESTHVAQMLQPGRFGLITGPPDTGKTDIFWEMAKIACQLFEEHQRVGRGSKLEEIAREVRLETDRERRVSSDLEEDDDEADEDVPSGLPTMASAKKFVIVSNIPTGAGPYAEHFVFETSLSGTLEAIAKARLEGAFVWWGIDELAMNVDKYTRGKAEVKSVEASWRTIRKSGGAIWFISQDDSDLANTFRKWCQTEITKRGRKRALIHVQGVHQLLVVRKIPSSMKTINFNTESRAGFEIDIDMVELSRLVSEVEKAVGFSDPVATTRAINEAIIAYCQESRRRRDLARREVDDSPAGPPSRPSRRPRATA